MTNWVEIAKEYLGVKEIPGKQHNPAITKWLIGLKAWWADDETPWCGTFVANCLRLCGCDLPKNWYRALAWADWGTKLQNPVYGCIAIKKREGGGHVFFVVGRSADWQYIYGLGGNQSDEVNIRRFAASEIFAYRYPESKPIPTMKMPILSGISQSISEA